MPPPPADSNVTQLLQSVGLGDQRASDELLGILQDELRRAAGEKLNRLPPGQTLQPTALVHEVYLRLVGQGPLGVKDRRDFLRFAVRAMQDVLVETSRRKAALKHGGDRRRVDLTAEGLTADVRPEELFALDEALTALAEKDARKAELVRLRFFVGLSEEEIAEVLEVSVRTVRRDWRFARAWLSKTLAGEDEL